MADATYQPKIYRAQGGAELVISASGTLTLEGATAVASGSSMTFASGSGLALASGSSFTCATDMEIASGGKIALASGSSMTFASGSGLALASGSSATCATDLEIASGGKIALASGSSMTIASGSAVSVAAPIVCATGGYLAEVVQTAATTDTTILPYGLTLVAGTTAGPTFLISNPLVGVPKFLAITGTTADTLRALVSGGTTTVTFDTSGPHILTLASTGLRGVMLVGATTLAYRVVGAFYSGDAGLST